MDRRTYLGLGGGLLASLAGCTANALQRPDLLGTETPDRACPGIGAFDRAVCPEDDGPVSVSRSSRVVSGASWSLVVGVLNHTEPDLTVSPGSWSLFSRSQSEWTPIVPSAPVQESRSLEPGEQYQWQLTAGSEGLSDPDRRVYLDLAPGEYAFVVPLGSDRRYGAVAPFEVTD